MSSSHLIESQDELSFKKICRLKRQYRLKSVKNYITYMQQAEGDSKYSIHKFGNQCNSKEVRSYKNNDRLK